jgi:hypothetical protein
LNSQLNFREAAKLSFEGALKLIGLIGAACAGLGAICAGVIKIFKLAELISDMHKGFINQKEDNKILFKSQLACLDGLIQNEANGPVTKAKNNLEQYILERFGGD